MKLVTYNPLPDLRRMEKELDKLWDTDWGMFPAVAETAPMDMYQENGNLVAEVNLPNFTKKDIRVTTTDGVLEVMAEHNEKQEKNTKRQYYLHESSNHYMRRIALPEGVKYDKAKAGFKDGVLKITMPTEPKKLAQTVDVT
jgi:HSP20 family protein